MSTETTNASADPFNLQDSWLSTFDSGFDEQLWGPTGMTMPSWTPVNPANCDNFDLGVQTGLMTPMTTPLQPSLINPTNTDNFIGSSNELTMSMLRPTSATFSPTAAPASSGGGSSKKRKYNKHREDSNVQSMKGSQGRPLRIEDLSDSDYQKLQKMIEDARDEALEQSQEMKRLSARIVVLEQEVLDFKEGLAANVTTMKEELKDVLGFKRVVGAAFTSLGW